MKEVINYQHNKIDISKGCKYCPLRYEQNDGMNITEICIYGNYLIIFPERCCLSDEEKAEVQGKTLIQTTYIED